MRLLLSYLFESEQIKYIYIYSPHNFLVLCTGYFICTELIVIFFFFKTFTKFYDGKYMFNSDMNGLR